MAGKPSRGLADVVVASPAVSDIDGRAGRLSYRGNRLIRPGRAYVGETGLTWIPVADR